VLHPGDLSTNLQDFWLLRTRSTGPESIGNDSPPETAASDGVAKIEEIVSMAELEKQTILETIRKVGGKKLKAAELLGIGKTTLYRKLREYEIAQS